MDPLSEILAVLKPESYLTAGIDAGGKWAIRFGNRPGTIKCHAVTAGDCIILPSGQAFMLASDLTLTQPRRRTCWSMPGRVT